MLIDEIGFLNIEYRILPTLKLLIAPVLCRDQYNQKDIQSVNRILLRKGILFIILGEWVIFNHCFCWRLFLCCIVFVKLYILQTQKKHKPPLPPPMVQLLRLPLRPLLLHQRLPNRLHQRLPNRLHRSHSSHWTCVSGATRTGRCWLLLMKLGDVSTFWRSGTGDSSLRVTWLELFH